MDPEPSRSNTFDTSEPDRNSSTVVNALIGAVAGIVLSFIPLSTVLGGAVAGYLEAGDTSDGMRIGALAGLIMFVPFVFIGLFVILFVVGFATGGPSIAFSVVVVVLLLFGAVYTVGLSAIGGYLGVYLRHEL